MDDIRQRLLSCFEAVFPNREPAKLVELSQAAEPAWDSLAAVTLFRLIEEQFQIQLDLFEMQELDSFPAIENHIRQAHLDGA